MVTVPFNASSRTLAEIVVLIGTPSLLYANKAVLKKARSLSKLRTEEQKVLPE